ncbi:MAG: recombination factor protein RarA, partial [Pseudomonadota bacterium]
ALGAVRAVVAETGTLPVPLAIRNAPTKLMKELGYGRDYVYDHDVEGGVAIGQQCLPDEIADRQWYQPVGRGLELKIKEKLDALRAARAAGDDEA